MRYLDPKNDLTFKKVFGEHPHLLQSFLNAMLPLGEDQQIVSLEYLPAELVPEVPLFKHSIVDVRCADASGRQFIVEMQMLWTDSFKSRVLFNASKAYVSQLGRGGEYKALQPVYALSLVNQVFEPSTPEFYHHYRFVHSTEPTRCLEGLELVFVELPKFRPASFLGKRMQLLWLRYLTEIRDQGEHIPAELLAEPALEEAVEYLRESAFTRGELAGYDKYWDAISSERTLMSAALAEGIEQGIAQGIEQGIAQGIEQGIEQGINQGIAQGIDQGIARGIERGIERGKTEQTLELARRMLASGLTVEAVRQITGLDATQLPAPE